MSELQVGLVAGSIVGVFIATMVRPWVALVGVLFGNALYIIIKVV